MLEGPLDVDTTIRNAEVLIDSLSEDGSRVDATDVVDLGPRDRLPIGDDRDHLERGIGQPQGPRLLYLLQIRRELGERTQLVAPGHLPDLEGAMRLDVGFVELLHERAHLRGVAARQELRDARGRDRLRRGEDDGFYDASLLILIQCPLLT